MSPRPHIDEKTRLRCLLARFLFLTDIYGRQKLVDDWGPRRQLAKNTNQLCECMKHDLFGRTNNPNQEFLDALERYVQALSSTLHQLPSLIEPSRHSHVIVKRLAEAGGDDRRMRQLLSKAQASMGWRARWKKDLIRDEANVAKKLARRFSRLANDYDVLHWELEQLVDPNPINHKPAPQQNLWVIEPIGG